MPTFRSASSVALALLLAACASGGVPAAPAAGFDAARLKAGPFELLSHHRFGVGADTLTVYLEGDGAPWPRRGVPPADPTPAESLALALARADPGAAVAWLSRPCQFLSAATLAGCDSRYWRRARYAPEVVAAMDEAIGELLRRSGARRLVIAAHSGGAAIAVLVAARRRDVALLVTVGGVLDTAAWTSHHDVTPLDESLNPADFAGALSGLRQVHYVGGEDRVTPPAIAESFARRVGPAARVVRVAGRDHGCCWAHDWPRLFPPLLEDPS